MHATAILKAPWREPIDALEACADRDFTLALLSGGGGPRGRWSYLLTDPAEVLVIEPNDPRDPFAAMKQLLGTHAANVACGPPFQGGLAGLLGYDLGARLEPAAHVGTSPDWPDVACGLYLGVIAFDHLNHEVLAVGRGADQAQANARARAALDRLEDPATATADGPLTDAFEVITPGPVYEAAVAEVVARIVAGEIFQANIARAWGGRLKPAARPVDLVRRLELASPAPFAAYLRLPGKAVVSNSPERFVSVRDDGALQVETRPIKGTRPRRADGCP